MLSESAIRKAVPREKRYVLHDGNGLYLEVMPSGKKFWRIRMQFDGVVYRRSLGEYPFVSMKDARAACRALKLKAAVGENPFAAAEGRSFEVVAREWLRVKVVPIRSPRHVTGIVSKLELYVLPSLGERSLRSITAPELLRVLRPIEEKGLYETAHRTLQICGQVFRYGIATGDGERDVAADLRGALITVPKRHFPTIVRQEEVHALMRAIRGLDSPVIRCALLLQAFTFVRPGELRTAEWREFDLDRAEWEIPREKTKMKRSHLVPLSRQALEVLEELRGWSGSGRFLFPSARSKDRPMSDATANAALRRLGYTKEEFTGHSFRSMASTVLNENGWNRDWVERQLGHVEKNAIRAAYNHAEYLEDRRRMMEWWGEWVGGSEADTLI